MLRKLAILALAAAALPAAAADWSDNALSVTWGPSYAEPGIHESTDATKGIDIKKTTLGFTHASGDKLGGTFLNIDMLISEKKDPSLEISAGQSVQGATEVYAIYRRAWSLNKITGTKMFAFPFVRDVNVDMGIDLNTKNTAFASHKVLPVVGVSLAFDVPGFWNLGVLASKEWTHNGIVNKEVEFDVAPIVATSWGIPLGSFGLSFNGFFNLILPKGKDGFGNKTKMEILTQPKLTYAVGNIWGNPKAGWDVSVGYQYWLNKFGNDSRRTAARSPPPSSARSPTTCRSAVVQSPAGRGAPPSVAPAVPFSIGRGPAAAWRGAEPPQGPRTSGIVTRTGSPPASEKTIAEACRFRQPPRALWASTASSRVG